MTRRAGIGILVVAGTLGLAACGGSRALPLPGDTWGGRGASMTVQTDSSTLQFDCAHGRITAPWTLDSNGGFDLPGVYVKELGGPTPIGQPPPPEEPARYTGRIVADHMSLTIHITSTSQTVGPFDLVRGSAGILLRCL